MNNNNTVFLSLDNRGDSTIGEEDSVSYLNWIVEVRVRAGDSLIISKMGVIGGFDKKISILSSSSWSFWRKIGFPSMRFPVLIYGPLVSRRVETWWLGLFLRADWTPIIWPRCSSWSPCEKLRRATFNPWSISFKAISGCCVLGLDNKRKIPDCTNSFGSLPCPWGLIQQECSREVMHHLRSCSIIKFRWKIKQVFADFWYHLKFNLICINFLSILIQPLHNIFASG